MVLHLVLDIETVPDEDFPLPEKPEKLEKDEEVDVWGRARDRMLPPACNRIVAIGCLLFEGMLPKKIGLVAEGGGEREMVSGLVRWLDGAKPTVVTWNGRSFDMPAIAGRALKHGLPMPWWFSSRGTRYRYSTNGHFDLMDFLSDHGACRSMRLDHAARLVGFPGKIGVDGSRVAELIAEGELREVGSYCLCDVAQTAAIFLRAELLRGGIDDVASFRGLGRSLLAFVDAEPRLLALSEKIDRARFLLETQLDGAARLPVQTSQDTLVGLQENRRPSASGGG